MLWIALSSVLGSIGAAFLKGGAVRLELSLRSLLSNWRLGAGIIFYVLSSIPFLKGIQVGELSVLYPLVSLGYIWTMILSRVFYGERITRNKIAAIALILLGLILLTRDAQRPKEQAAPAAASVSVGLPVHGA